MPKMKTIGAYAKRFAVKKTKKNGKTITEVFKRTDGQDHFNGHEPGKVGRNKRSDRKVPVDFTRTISRAIPYAK